MTKRKPRRADFYADDWLSGPMDLSIDEEGAYIRVCALIYSKGRSIPDNERWLAGMCRVSTRRWRKLRHGLIDKGKITVMDGWIHQQRCEFELNRMAERSQKQAENVAKRWRKSAESEPKVSRKSAESEPKVNRENDEAGRNPLENRDCEDTTEYTNAIPTHQPPTTNLIKPTSGTILSSLSSDHHHTGGQKENDTGHGESSEDMFWSLVDKAAAVNVTRGLMGKLAGAMGDFDKAYPALLGALGKKNPPAYVAKIIKNETQEQDARDAAAEGGDSGEPAFVQEAYRAGQAVERLPEGTWRIAGTIYSPEGEEVGW